MHARLAAFVRAVHREHGAREGATWLALATLRKRAFSSAFALRRSVERRLTVLEEQRSAAGWRARLRVERSSRLFAGHFDGDPVLPGVVHLLVVGHALRVLQGPEAALRELSSVRFRRAVRPGEELEVTVGAPDSGGGCRFEVRAGGERVASGRVRGAVG